MSDTPLTATQLLAQIEEEQKKEKEFERKEEAWLTVIVASHRTFCNCTTWKTHLYQLLRDSLSDKWSESGIHTEEDDAPGDDGEDGGADTIGDSELVAAAEEAEATAGEE